MTGEGAGSAGWAVGLTRRFGHLTAVVGGESSFGLGLDLAVQLAVWALLVGLAARPYPRVVL